MSLVRILESVKQLVLRILKEQELTYLHQLRELKRLLLWHPWGITDIEVAVLMRVSRGTVWRMRQDLENVEEITEGHYTYCPNKDEVEFAEAIIWRVKQAANNK